MIRWENHHPRRLRLPGRVERRVDRGEPLRGGGVHPPQHLLLKTLPVGHRVSHVFRHESLPFTLETEQPAPGVILHDLGFAALLQHLRLKLREKLRFAPSELPKLKLPRRIELEKLVQVDILRQAVGAPGVEAHPQAEGFLDQSGSRHTRVGVAVFTDHRSSFSHRGYLHFYRLGISFL